jgi:predicted dehydrogenase
VSDVLSVGILGCGLIGKKRAAALGPHRLVAVADPDKKRADSLAFDFPGARAYGDASDLLSHPGLEVVVIATTHDQLSPLALQAVRAGKHVLVEKPAGRNHAELDAVSRVALDKRLVVKVGFNHRFHPSVAKAREILAGPQPGPLMFIRARYGHGGRVGYDQEWRAVRKISGGGELIDQGIHLIDLARVFLGDFSEASGYLPTYFWKMEVEDNAFMLLKTRSGQAAWLHATWTEWKNTFSFEIFARNAKLHWEGLGGSYGTERLTYYPMKPEMGPPEAQVFEFPAGDRSWVLEFENFAEAIRRGLRPDGDVQDGLAALAIVDKLYAGNGSLEGTKP